MVESDEQRAISFTGTWREYAPIAFTNLLLAIVTLGLYLFWARARERRYLWSRTHFIDDALEYTGTGFELFIGYLFAFVFILLPLGVLSQLPQAAIFRGHAGLAALIAFGGYILVYYLTGIARFRAVRYRLSRTYWHGIRGGSNVQGVGFGWSYLWKSMIGYLALGLMIPWSMTSLWNERWRQMSFGPYNFWAEGSYERIFLRYLLFYLMPVVLFIGSIVLAAFIGGIGAAAASVGNAPDEITIAAMVAIVVLGLLVFYLGLGIIALSYYSAFYREMIDKLSLGSLEFGFTARTWDWVRLWGGNLALVVGTLGVGYIFVGYRNWVFFVRHLRAYGEVRLDEMTQSTTRDPGQGEGLLDAFDVGAF